MERLHGQRRGAKITTDHLYSSTLIRGIVKNQIPNVSADGRRVAYRGDNRSCRIIYPINGLHALNVAGCLIYEQGPIDFVGR